MALIISNQTILNTTPAYAYSQPAGQLTTKRIKAILASAAAEGAENTVSEKFMPDRFSTRPIEIETPIKSGLVRPDKA